MLMAILRAIAAGIRAALAPLGWLFRGLSWAAEHTVRAADAALGLPAAVLRAVSGGAGTPPPLPQPERLVGERRDPELENALRALAHRHVRRPLARDPLAAVWRYACAEPRARDEIDLSGVPRDVQTWVRSLTADELEALRQAGLRATVRHVRGDELVPGVHRVRKLVPEGGLLAPATEPEVRRPRRRASRRRESEPEFSGAFGLA